MSLYYQQVQEAASFVREQTEVRPAVGIIFGTGLSDIGELIQVDVSVPYGSIPTFPEATVESHTGELLLGYIDEVPVAALQGRFHLYEGYSAKEVTFPVRVLGTLGVQTLIASNASGGINPGFRRGDIVLVTDHINLQGANPLEGPNLEDWGPRFPDMSEPYDLELRNIAREVALEKGFRLQEGVYVVVEGPNLETRAEYRFLGNLGADMVGMSTVPEVIVARHMGMSVMVVSVITDECQPGALEPIDIEEVFAALEEARPHVKYLLSRTITRTRFRVSQ